MQTNIQSNLISPISSLSPPGSPFAPLDATTLPAPHFVGTEPPVLEFNRIDLDTRIHENHYGQHAAKFLRSHRDELQIEDSDRILGDWLEKTWPTGEVREFWLTKLPPQNGRHSWLIRPVEPVSAQPTTENMGRVGVAPQFRVFFRDGTLVLLGFEPGRRGIPKNPTVRLRGVVHLDPRCGRMTKVDEARLLEVPHFTVSTQERLTEWRKYLDWREKLTEENSKHRYPYGEWELRKDRKTVRFHLRGQVPIDLLKLRFQGQALLAHQATKAIRPYMSDAPAVVRKSPSCGGASCAYRAISAQGDDKNRQAGSGEWRHRRKSGPSEPPAPQQEASVDVVLNEEMKWRLDQGNEDDLFPAEGELAVDVTGELSTIRNQRIGIERLEQGRAINLGLHDWLFNSQRAQLSATTPAFTPTVSILNEEQIKSVAGALAAPDAFYLQGPPGTGKTTVIGELCRQSVRQDRRCLVASQANLAVDNALAGLIPLGQTMPDMRPLRWLEERKELDVEEPFKRFLRKRAVRDWLTRVAAACEADLAMQPGAAGNDWSDFKHAWVERIKSHETGDDAEELRDLYVRQANVVGATCNATGKIDFYNSAALHAAFDLVVVDEVSKATPPELLMPLLLGVKAVLVGDHRQLPPMFKTDTFEEAVANGEFEAAKLIEFKELVTTSFFEQSFLSAPLALRNTLREQYRMHPQIMDVINNFYPDGSGKGILLPGGGREHRHRERRHELSLKGRRGGALLKPGQHALWVDSTEDLTGCPVAEGPKRGTSRWNQFEIDLIAGFLEELHQERHRANGGAGDRLDVGVISFYLAQTNELRDQFRGKWSSLDVQVNTVDQFQGRECSVVIVSLVRCDEVSGEFVKDYRRINVAFSRAKQLLVIVGSRRAFVQAVVPVAPVEGGEPIPKKVYGVINEQITRFGGARTPHHLLTA